MFIFKKLVFLIIFILLNGCTLNNLEKKQSVNNFSIEVNTPNDKYNIYLKENLKRFFYINTNQNKFTLKTKITFNSTKTLSVSGQNILKSTKAKIDYQLINKNTNIIVKSGSINTFPALSSSSNSLYAQDNSIDFIKERLTKSAAKSLYSRIKIILRRLS
jgi:outer membrane lipopolysaccharide assembly protein LptE/RlpB